ncbi:MAG TPA: mycothiol conjugate amidase Mca [Chloroflexota bacterium]|nr:mycothiol conjugate amidase Mca [Chloroflexota bacterium]
MTSPAASPLCLLTIHAHPDDEASKGSATVAKYAAAGARTVLVCCTGGEAGEVLNKAMDTPEILANLPAIRAEELSGSVAAIGYAAVHRLGYHDSGMPESEWNLRPDNFHNAPLEEAVGKLVAIVRAERPQVIVTYADGRAGYAHPDHLRVHDISGPAFDAAGDPSQYPELGEPWQPLKLYYIGGAMSAKRMQALTALYAAIGEENPFAQWQARRRQRGLPEMRADTVTTLIDVGDFLAVRRAALLAHRTQIDPDSAWLRIPDDALRTAFPWDEYELARSLVENHVAEGEMERDLFAGIR